MLATSLVLGSFLTVLFFIIGIVIGWVAREYMMNYKEIAQGHQYHPEFYDSEGRFIDQEIVSVRFDPVNFLDEDFEDDDDED
jgi:hypothetical protein